jgi:hypothetical protein
MGNYGLRVSQEGQDVKSCGDEKTGLNSKYPMLKQALTGSGSVAVDDDLVNVDVSHGLGYTPFAIIFFKLASDPDGAYQNDPWEDFNYDDNLVHVWHYCTSSILKMWFQVDFGADTFYYKYYIFLDKGKL